jgi:hypothetical protein
MKAKCISNKNKKRSITIGNSYVIFAGRCLKNNVGSKVIESIYIQDDSGSVGIYDTTDFQIQNISFEKYTFVLKNQDDFLANNIAYDGFWAMLYGDSPDGIEEYNKAKHDFKTAKMILYKEYSLEELRVRILNDSLDERDFIFEFLRIEQNDGFLELAIDIIKDGMKDEVRYFEVDEIFKYLASFKNKSVEDFFIEYTSVDVWENEEINSIVYNYF